MILVMEDALFIACVSSFHLLEHLYVIEFLKKANFWMTKNVFILFVYLFKKMIACTCHTYGISV